MSLGGSGDLVSIWVGVCVNVVVFLVGGGVCVRVVVVLDVSFIRVILYSISS